MKPMILDEEIESDITRLLRELSWEGKNIKAFREGGRGFENVLTTEVLQALDFLPRHHFLAEVLKQAHSTSCDALALLIAQAEECEIGLLPGNRFLCRDDESTRSVQPDGVIESTGVCCLIEAKRIKRSTFSITQLACEYFLVTAQCGDKAPLLFLILGSAPPIPVTGRGRLDIEDAVHLSLASVYKQAAKHPLPLAAIEAGLPNSIAWITWQEISVIVAAQADKFESGSSSVDGCVRRLAASVTEAIKWHGDSLTAPSTSLTTDEIGRQGAAKPGTTVETSPRSEIGNRIEQGRRNKRPPPLSSEELRTRADVNQVLPLYEQVLATLRPLFETATRTQSNLALNAMVDGSRCVIIGVCPDASSAARGIALMFYVDRVAQFFGIPEDSVKRFLGPTQGDADTWCPEKTWFFSKTRLDELVRFLSKEE